MFRFAGSVLLQGGRGAAGRYHWRVQGTLAMSGHTGFAPAHRCVLSPSTLLRLRAALYGAGPALRAVPVFRYSTKAWTWLGLRFVPSSAEQLRLPGACRAHSPRVRCTFSPPRSQPQFPPVGCVLCLFWGAGLLLRPSRQMSATQNLRKSLVRDWKPVCSLVGVPSLGPSLPLSPPHCLLPLARDGLFRSWLALLWDHSVFLLFCQQPAVCSVSTFRRLICSLSCHPTV